MPQIVDIEALTPEQRLDLIGEIWNGLNVDPKNVPVDEEVMSLLDRRREAYERDPATASTWEDVRARILGHS